jgi:hypothetical protein
VILTSTGDLEKVNRNDLLSEFRMNYQSDSWATTVEWLIQLARHWSQWQDSRIGTFPLDYRDPSGPVARAESDYTGEDSAYYEIDDIIKDILSDMNCRIIDTDEGWTWLPGYGKLPDAGDRIQDLIVHTTAVLSHLLKQLELAGYGN